MKLFKTINQFLSGNVRTNYKMYPQLSRAEDVFNAQQVLERRGYVVLCQAQYDDQDKATGLWCVNLQDGLGRFLIEETTKDPAATLETWKKTFLRNTAFDKSW